MVPLIDPTNPITTKGTEPMWGDTTITLVGNLVDDPELRFTPSGDAVARFRLASTPRYLDRQAEEWKDGESLFLTCTAWRQVAENVTESTQRGMRVIVQGRLRQRSYQTDDGHKRTVYEIQVDDVGPSLRHATAKVTKAWRSTGETNGGFGHPDRAGNDSGAGRGVDTTAMDSWRRQPEPVGAGEPPF